MFTQDETSPNATVILLAAGGAALAALLVVLARRDHEEDKSPAESVAQAAKDGSKKAEKRARKLGKDVAASTEAVREAMPGVDIDARSAERDLKAAAWDAQQQAREAESRLRAAGHRVVDDASQLASRVGSEARNLADEGRERIAHLRHQDSPTEELEREVTRLRAELEELRSGHGGGGRGLAWVSQRAERPWGPKSRSMEVMASEAASAALAQIEKSLRAKAPELIAAKNRVQLMEILQRELGPTLRDSAVQATMAAVAAMEAAREGAGQDLDRRARDAGADARRRADDISETARNLVGKLQDSARHTSDSAKETVEPALANGKERLELTGDAIREATAEQRKAVDEAVSAATERESSEERHSKSGLFWGAASMGLAAYALLDPERRDKILKFANEASVQVQEMVRDLQGYDDEF